ncbi:MAG: PQQ-binding-like beta-propeller repeat protein [Phycisphaerales bacterium]|jgi:outer membrane protein assembly factor BamB
MKTTGFAVLILLVSCSVLQSADWPQWRGPNRDGISAETGLLKQWPPAGPPLLWEKAGLGEGYSSVAVVGDIIYATGKIDANEYCTALDLEGNVKWQTDYGRAWNKSDHRRARCTPTVSGNHLYLISGLGDVSCLNRNDGTVLWKVDGLKRFGGSGHEIQGIAESPLVVDNKVIFTAGGGRTSVTALNCSTGRTLWTSQSVGGTTCFVSPLRIKVNNRDMVIASTAEALIGVYADNGRIAWRNSDINWAVTPAYDNDCFYNGHKLFRISENSNQIQEIWTSELIAGQSHFIRLGNHLYGSMREPPGMGFQLTCLDWQTGKVLYKIGRILNAALIAADGMLYSYEQGRGRVSLIRPGPEDAEIVGSFRISKGRGPYFAHPVISNGRLYIRHGDYLMVYDIREKVS